MQAKKLYLRSFGCQMNDYDSGRIADLLNAEMGYERTDVLEEADLVVVNTCSIREKAQEKTFSDLGRIREVKKTRRHADRRGRLRREPGGRKRHPPRALR